MSDHMTGDLYSLAQGPIRLARGNRERKEGNAFPKNGKQCEIKVLLECCAFFLSLHASGGTNVDICSSLDFQTKGPFRRYAIICHQFVISFTILSFYFLRIQSFAMSVFVMCAACMAGTALMIVKKSRDKPIGYTLLASGGQE